MISIKYRTSWLIIAIVLLAIKALSDGFSNFQNLKNVFQNTDNPNKQLALFLGITIENFLFLGALFFFIVALFIKIKDNK